MSDPSEAQAEIDFALGYAIVKALQHEVKTAEAEIDRLREALRQIEAIGYLGGAEVVEIARAALAKEIGE
jgi:hypothetical protein